MPGTWNQDRIAIPANIRKNRHRPLGLGRFFLLLLILAGNCFVGAAQTPVPGTGSTVVPDPASGHDYIHGLVETVDPASGSVSLRIPVPIPRGRGFSLPFNIAYDSNGVYAALSSSLAYSGGYLSSGGWSYTLPSSSLDSGQVQYPTVHGFYYCPFATNWKFGDENGGRHALGLYSSRQVTSGTYQCRLHEILNGTSWPYLSSVSSGAQEPTDLKVLNSSGTIYSFRSNPVVSLPGNSSTVVASRVEDRNGNYVSISDNGTGAFTETDTLGRPILSSSGFGSTGNTLTLYGYSVPYTLNWESQTTTFPPQASLIYSVQPNTCPSTTFGASFGGSLSMIQQISLPDGQAYTFEYDPQYGLLKKITYPSGGWVAYTWQINTGSVQSWGPDIASDPLTCFYQYGKAALATRSVSFDGTTVALSQTFQYSTTWPSCNSTRWSTKQTTVTSTYATTRDLSHGQTETIVYNYLPLTGGNPPCPANPRVDYDTAVPYESSVSYKDGSGTVIATKTENWSSVAAVQSTSTSFNGQPASKTVYSYTNGEQLAEKDEYDFGGTTLLRKTVINYQAFSPTPLFSRTGLFDRPCQQLIYDGGGNLAAETDYYYDGTPAATPCSTATTQSVSGTGNYSNHDETTFGPTSTVARGNLTTTVKKCFAGGASCPQGNSITTAQYDETGQMISATDACGNVACGDMAGSAHTTTYSYLDNFDSNPSTQTNALLTKITNPLGQNTRFQYAYSDGQLLQSTDANSQPTNHSYDSLHRLIEIDLPPDPNNSSQRGKTTFGYSNTFLHPSMTTSRLLNTSGQYLTNVATMDGMGHVVTTVQNGNPATDPDCASGDRVDTVHDGLGRTATSSNPYCSPSDPTYGITQYSYDPLGRTTQVTHPDGSTMLTSYWGRAIQVQDEGNGTQRVARISQSDALGRLAFVCEVAPGNPPFVGAGGQPSSSLIGQNGSPASCGLDIAGTGFLTSYQYGTLDDLTQVSEGTMAARTFGYNSLSELTSASNPESNSVGYTYDANSNLSSKTDARSIKTTYLYDALNRLTQKSYSDNTTPAANFVYDVSAIGSVSGIPNTVGRLVEAYTGNTFTINFYDPMGRITQQLQGTPVLVGTNVGYYRVPYSYDLAGNVTSASDGNFHTDSLTYNPVGRLLSLSTNIASPTSLISNPHYNPLGQPTSDSLGDSEIETFNYDNRGRPKTALSTYNAVTTYSYNISSYAPDGDILAANDSVNGNWTYGYDPFNRLVGANQNSGAAIYSYVYDRFGNRWQQNGPFANSAQFTGNNPSAPANNNRMDGYSYDLAGNLLSDNSGHTFAYDAENRLVSGTYKVGASTFNYSYTYDANGNRVHRTGFTGDTCDATGVRDYIFDLAGRVASEVNSNATECNDEIYAGSRHVGSTRGAIIFSHTDWLGTERVRITAAYASNRAYDEHCQSLPFGDNLGPCTAGSYSSPLHFTGKERDSESGLDDFGARYFTSGTGRFISPNPIGGRPAFPQSWNGYSYVLNNPLNAIDPFGLDCVYLNNAGYGVEYIDQQSNATECAQNGGAWANGLVNSIQFDPNSNNVLLGYYTGTVDSSGNISSLQENRVTVTPGQFGPGDQIYSFAASLNQWNVMNNTLKLYGAGAVIGATGGTACYLYCGYLGVGTITTLGATAGGTVGPIVSDSRLQEVIDELYQVTDQIPGGTAGAVRYELRTGNLLSASGHSQEAGEIITRLTNLLKTNTLSLHDQIVARQEIQDLKTALTTSRF